MQPCHSCKTLALCHDAVRRTGAFSSPILVLKDTLFLLFRDMGCLQDYVLPHSTFEHDTKCFAGVSSSKLSLGDQAIKPTTRAG